MINVAHMRSTTGFYGAEKVIFNIFENIEDQDISLSLITLENNTKLSALLRNKISNLSFITKEYQLNKKYDKQAINAINLQLSTEKIQLVHTHDYKSLFYALKASKNLTIKIIHHMHGYLNNTISERLYALLEKYLINKVTVIFVVSDDLKNRLEGSLLVKNKAIRFLANGVQLNASNGSNKSDNPKLINISMIARFTSEKNHLLALETAKKLKHKNVCFMLNLYGDGALREQIQNYIASHDLKQNVELHGYQKDMSVVYQTSDILLITSLTEGLPMVLLEAMSNGIAIVSTNVGQIAEVLNQETCGLLTSFKADDVSNKLLQLLANKTRLEKLGQNAIKRVQNNYSISSQIKAICNTYKEII